VRPDDRPDEAGDDVVAGKDGVEQVEELEPKIKIANFELQKKYVSSPFRDQLPRDVYGLEDKRRQNAVSIFRTENVELEKTEDKKGESKFDAVAEFARLTSSRSGGVYMPPARLRALQAAAAQDRSSAEYQRLSWDALRKSITGIVNRVNVGNIKHVVPELFSENLIRGRGLFARSIMKAQAASLPFTAVFAALVSIVNTKLPMIGELLLHRLISQFRRAFKRNDKVRQKYIQGFVNLCRPPRLFVIPRPLFSHISSIKALPTS